MFKTRRTRLKTEKNLDDQDRATSRSGCVLCFGDEVKWWLFCFRSCKFAVAKKMTKSDSAKNHLFQGGLFGGKGGASNQVVKSPSSVPQKVFSKLSDVLKLRIHKRKISQ